MVTFTDVTDNYRVKQLEVPPVESENMTDTAR